VAGRYFGPMRPVALLLLLLNVPCTANNDSAAVSSERRAGMVELFMEFMASRYQGADLSGDILYASVHRQRLYHISGGRLVGEYPIATASNGPGNRKDSYCTPTGLHRVYKKIGDGVPAFGIFKDRIHTGRIADPVENEEDLDLITSRVLWLEGLEQGSNRGGTVDSRGRHIYIHGTANERSIGTPSSRGCIRMLNADVIALYDRIAVGTLVVVLDN
jgi:hypothetical protein